jgi:hypothetical protein
MSGSSRDLEKRFMVRLSYLVPRPHFAVFVADSIDSPRTVLVTEHCYTSSTGE